MFQNWGQGALGIIEADVSLTLFDARSMRLT
jgi:hypothetical protein